MYPGKLMVFATIAFAWAKLEKSESINRYLLFVLSVYFLTELIMPLLSYNQFDTGWLTNVSVLAQSLIWIRILGCISGNPYTVWNWMLTFFSLYLFIFSDGLHHFNYYPFVLTSAIYILLFMKLCVKHLNTENISFFSDNRFLLMFAPVLFFSGMSLLFAFNSREVTSTTVFGIKVYYWVNVMVNLQFYAIICIYVFRRNRKLS